MTGAVIAVSATATASEINAIKSAAEVAGFEEVLTIGSDIAIALAHGFDRVQETKCSPNIQEEKTPAKEGMTETVVALQPNNPARRILIFDVGMLSNCFYPDVQ